MGDSNGIFRIKICGVKTPAGARAAADAGADAIGLNFYTPSIRYLALDRARQVISAVPPHVRKVGVYVNESSARIRELHKELKLDFVQLHGDETPEIVAELPGIRVLRAFAATRVEAPNIIAFVEACRALNPLAGVLIDAYSPDERGGTGKTADWELAAELRAQLADVPLILAGGLKPGNVADAIRAVRPFGVDTASGVESSPGVKDAALIQQFVANAREAFGAGLQAGSL